jgi:ATP-binding protein involved in chromosome partitioning
MSSFTCSCGEVHEIFGRGGGKELAEELHVPLLAEIPLREEVAHGGDAGEPAGLSDGPTGALFAEMATRIIDDIAPPLGAVGCSARLLDAVERAVRSAD